MRDSEIINKYIRQRDIYYQNAELFLGRKRYRKSSELMWGAITQTIKAIAAASGHKIRNHGQFFTFMETLSDELNDEYYYSEFLKMNMLHKNFYDEEIPPKSFEMIFNSAIKYLEKLNELLEEKLVET